MKSTVFTSSIKHFNSNFQIISQTKKVVKPMLQFNYDLENIEPHQLDAGMGFKKKNDKKSKEIKKKAPAKGGSGRKVNPWI